MCGNVAQLRTADSKRQGKGDTISQSSAPNLLTVTVGIAAYNAEDNIGALLRSLNKQRGAKHRLERIIVYSDASDDRTSQIVNKLRDTRVHFIDGKVRKGFANAVKTILDMNTSQVCVLLNDDITIEDPLFIEKATRPFLRGKVGLACVNIQPRRPVNFLEAAVGSGFIAYRKTAERVNSGRNGLTADGKVLAFSKAFIPTIKFPRDFRRMGNVDSYVYMSCLANGFAYQYVPAAVAHCKMPTTTQDFTNWQTRNFTSNAIVRHSFGSAVNEAFRLPVVTFTYYRALEFVKNPVGSLYILVLGMYSARKAKSPGNQFNETWSVIKSTKGQVQAKT